MPDGKGIGPRIDVVVPTRNRAGLAVGAVRNALQQTGVDVRVIVVVDGTEDETAHVVRDLEDDRVSVLEHEGQSGLSAARNDGIAHGDSPWIAFLDDDDRWAPDKLHSQVVALAENPSAAWVVTGCVRTDGELRPQTTWDIAEGG
ncbi:MAG TPA: glycosyltransferase family 2 protein, partial [Acidimicrobiales bacterium]